MKTSESKVKFAWKTNRRKYIDACAAVILEHDIPQEHFWEECRAMFEIAMEKHIAFTRYGEPTSEQIKRSRNLVYVAFKKDLKVLVFDKMRSMDDEEFWSDL